MPKKIWKIDKFHGGLNNNSNPRDLEDNELSDIQDAMVDQIGAIRPMSSFNNSLLHNKTGWVNPSVTGGYGLYQFSHDRVKGHGGEELGNVQNYTTGWSFDDLGGAVADQCDFSAVTSFTWTQGTGTDGKVFQTAANRTTPGSNGASYILQITIAANGIGAHRANNRILGGSGEFAASDVNFQIDYQFTGTLEIPFTSHSAASTGAFSISPNLNNGESITISKMSLKLVTSDIEETGDNYILLSDSDTTGVVNVYSDQSEQWGRPIRGLTNNTGGTRKDIFYSIDGAVRVCDSNFKNTNPSKWYGFIDRTIFHNTGVGYAINEWYLANQEIAKPITSYYKNGHIITAGNTGDQSVIDGGWESHSRPSAPLDAREIARTALNADFTSGGTGTAIGTEKVFSCTFSISVTLTDWSSVECTVKAGPYNTDSSGTWSSYAVEEKVHSSAGFSPGSNWPLGEFTFYYNTAQTNTGTSDWTGGGLTAGNDRWRVEITSRGSGETATTYTIDSITIKEEAAAAPELDSGGSVLSNGYSTANNAVMLLDWGRRTISGATAASTCTITSTGHGLQTGQQIRITDVEGMTQLNGNDYKIIVTNANEFTLTDLSDATINSSGYSSYTSGGIATMNENIQGKGWNNDDNEGKWNLAASFVYDEVQESRLTYLYDEASNNPSSLSVPGGGKSANPAFLLAIAHPGYDGAGDGDGTSFNKRITGCNIYVQDAGQDTTEPWFLLASGDYITGKLTMTTTQKEYDAQANIDTTNQSYFMWHIPATEIQNVPDVITYELNSGISSDEKSITARYKTAVVANRMTYAANLRHEYEDAPFNEIKGDAMIKSPVNKFDVFPSNRIVEVSVRDGDQIIKLEEYADRILQFKKKKMHLINVSGDIEYLEDTLMYKGVMHPAAVCKTDFGVAWVNRHGAYLYDGEEVHNLLEKKGIQRIKESTWDTFITNDSIITYLPENRQLMVLKSCTGANGDIYLYDLVTRSWTTGNSKITDSTVQTNFIASGELSSISAIDVGDTLVSYSNYIYYWLGLSQPSTAFKVYTKDFDFGNPGVRKKIYKVIVTYKSSDGPARPAVTKVICTADVSDSLDGKYFDIYTGAGKTEIWFDTDNSGTSAPAGSGSYADTIEVTQVGTNDSSERVAIALASAINEDAGGYSTATVDGDMVTITDASNAARTVSVDGDTGFEVFTSDEGHGSGGNLDIDVKYALDGGHYITATQFNANLDASSSLNETIVELTPSSAIDDAKSIRLFFEGTSGSDFYINNIEIVYREKKIK